MQQQQLNHRHHRGRTKTYPVCLLAHDIISPMNIGSLFRIADALGLEKIYLTGQSITPPNSKLTKTARSCDKVVAYAYTPNPLDVIADLKEENYRILSLEITSQSTPLDKVNISPDDKICLILGAEKQGVPQQLLDASDEAVHIPMLGTNSSMNVATACGIACYQITQNLSPG